jgi:hypothetical protein
MNVLNVMAAFSICVVFGAISVLATQHAIVKALAWVVKHGQLSKIDTRETDKVVALQKELSTLAISVATSTPIAVVCWTIFTITGALLFVLYFV